MSVAACLLLYGFAVAVLAPRLLCLVGHNGAAPHFALAAWMSAIATTVLAWIAALVILVVDLLTHQISSVPERFVNSCLWHLHDAWIGSYGAPVQIGLWLLTGLVGLAMTVVAIRLCRTLLRARRVTLEHGRMARIAGRHHPGLDAVILEVDQPAAYCVAGKPHTVVVSRGVLAALDEQHLEAVLSHERAHLAGRHHLLLGLTRGLATVMPRINLFTLGAAEVAWLLEMVADDAAARAHGRDTVLQALLALSGITGESAPQRGTAEVALTARVARLAAPATMPVRARARLSLTAAATTATLVPLAAVVAAAVGFVIGDPMFDNHN
ncbi:M56 family metallopeptidase [Nocardia sp. NPDC020380]|uniref:M56 family metallopeptidase n=1 Tax=Nocardia sp. NPDC020380 TaxID=3364309 RepID=UPI0037B95E3A